MSISGRASIERIGAVFRLILAIGLAATLGVAAPERTPAAVDEAQVSSLQVPPGFRVNVFAEGLGYVRFMTFSPEGHLVASSPSLAQYGDTCGGGSCPAGEGRVFI